MQEHGIHKSVADLRPYFLTDFPTQPQEMLQGESPSILSLRVPSPRHCNLSGSQLPFLVEVKILEHHTVVLYSVSDIAPFFLPPLRKVKNKTKQTKSHHQEPEASFYLSMNSREPLSLSLDYDI